MVSLKYEYDNEKGSLKLELSEDIDMGACKTLREIIDGYIIRYSPKECIFDMGKVKFMDSSGLGLIMGRYNLIKMFNGQMVLINPCESVRKILEMTKLSDEIKIV